MRYITVKCTKCKNSGKLDVGTLDMEGVIEAMSKEKEFGFHCNLGNHVEFGRMSDYWVIVSDIIDDGVAKETDEEWQDNIGLGPFYTTERVREHFEIDSFSAPFCFGKSKDTGNEVVLSFGHAPSGTRYYWEV